MNNTTTPLQTILEAALLAAGEPVTLSRLQDLFSEIEKPSTSDIKDALNELNVSYEGRGIEVAEVASGYTIRARAEFSPWISRLWVERPQKYSRALLETLAFIAYRQPVTRAEIEDIRGVSVSSQTIKTLLEREWIHVVGQREVPGRPSLYATTKAFLDHFGLHSLEQLPALETLLLTTENAAGIEDAQAELFETTGLAITAQEVEEEFTEEVVLAEKE